MGKNFAITRLRTSIEAEVDMLESMRNAGGSEEKKSETPETWE